jgi:2-methylaconitate cis-trans-isomerase PrpF
MTERSIRAAIMRGGTSKGVFVHLGDLPPAGEGRDRVILALLGSPDPMQIDGLGGTHSSTSKLVAVSPSTHPGADVDYLFAQVAVDEPVVDYQGNCGNLTTAVAPFAIDEGIVDVTGPTAGVVLRNLNTGVLIAATVGIVAGRAAVEGDHVVAGVPGSGAPVGTAYLDPGGSVLGRVLPTGRPVDWIGVGDNRQIEVSVVDVTSPHAFVRAADIGVDAAIAPARANSDHELLARLEAVRRAAGALVGLSSPAIPRLVIVAPSPDGEADLDGRATSMGRMHHALPMTGALCMAAAAHIPGSVVHEAAASATGRLRIRHPKGVVDLTADVAADGPEVVVRSVGVVRTARRLMTGEAHIVVLD